MLETLKIYAASNDMTNVVFIPYQDKANLIYSLNSGDVHWCVNAKGIKGVSCPSKAYGIMTVGKPIIGVLEEGSEIRCLIDEIGCGKCCEPENYEEIESIVRWYMTNQDINEMGIKGRYYMENSLRKEISVRKYLDNIEEI